MNDFCSSTLESINREMQKSGVHTLQLVIVKKLLVVLLPPTPFPHPPQSSLLLPTLSPIQVKTKTQKERNNDRDFNDIIAIIIMWPSSNMSLKKLITNLCIFPARSSSTSSSFSNANKNNKPPAPSPAPPSFSTHLSRHFSTQPVHNHHQTDDEDPELDSTQQAKKEEKMMITRNFNVLDASTSKSTTPDNDEDEDVFFTSSSNHSDDHLISDHYHHNHNHNKQQPDFATAFASQRFFFSSPGHSRSLIHHQSSSTPPQLENIQTNNSGPLVLSAGGVPVPKYSPDPYWDFRTSMQEMMEARSEDVAENWEYLHKLLTCYLALNPKNTHECIIRAFSDLLVNFLLDKQADKYQTATGSATLSDGRTRSDLSRGGYCT